MKPSNLCIFWFSLSLAAADELNSSTNFGECTTPKKESGECVYLENCHYLYNLLQSSGLRDEDKTLLKQSHCGFNNKKVLVCCSKNVKTANMVTDKKEILRDCITPNQTQGLCKPIEDCPELYDLLRSNKLQQQEKIYLSQSQCEYSNGKFSVCCSKKFETVIPKINGRALLPQPGKCGNALSNRIYGGITTNIDEFPWMTLIEYTKENGNKGLHCGGSLINNRYVVTASHCVNGQGLPIGWQVTGVRLGEWDTSTNPDCETHDRGGSEDCAPPHIDVRVEKIISHPEYNPGSVNQYNDIALLRLAENVNFTDFIQPICLPLEPKLRSMTLDSVVMDVSGWGRTETSGTSNLKLKAPVVGTTVEQCRSVYQSQNKTISPLQICAGGQMGVDSCRGDSGGPLIALDTTNKMRVYYYLAGIVSFGPQPCGLEGWPGVYTNLSAFIDWIEEAIEP